MNALSPLPLHYEHEVTPEEIDADFQREAELRILARAITADGARSALKVCLTDREVIDWNRSAQRYLDFDGDDDGDFTCMVEGLDGWLNSTGYGVPGEDQFWRDSAYAERSTWGMV